jgi:hypothetical protein
MLNLKPLAAFFESKLADGFLELLLNMMRLAFLFDGRFRRNIEGFQGRYLFRSKGGTIAAGAIFSHGRMTVSREAIENPNVVVTFRNEKALMGFLLAPKPDILGAVLRQDVVLEGNLNYLYRFAYMAKRLQLMALGQA